ncbi:MAG TPA: hypothetical protein VLE97_06360 [Gaiellaceae bacterium]|nr:hypothetical protein [Gaiellaceae bacterium]
MSVRRPKTKTKRCAHCKRRRPRLKIEWHPGIWEWQCSDFSSCDEAIARRRLLVKERLSRETNKEFWQRTKYKRGKNLDMSDPQDRKMSVLWNDIFRQKQHEVREEFL